MKHTAIKKINIIEIGLLIYFFLKPFYIRSSGTLQISDFIFIFTYLLFLSDEIYGVKIEKTDICFLVFVIYVMLINIFYFVYEHDNSFLKSYFYFMYVFAFIHIFRKCISIPFFVHKMVNVFRYTIWIQIVLYVLKKGNWYAGVRYIGTFHDPNQFAFYIFGVTLIISLVSCKEGWKWNNIICVFACVFLIGTSASRGMTMGILGSVVFYVLGGIAGRILRKKRTIKVKTLLKIIGLLVLVIGLVIILLQNLENSFVMIRWKSTIQSISAGGETSGSVSLFEDRGLDRFWTDWQYLFLGSGEGAYRRFHSYRAGEMHSTFLGILMCYGLPGFSFVLVWCHRQLKKLPLNILGLYGGLILESMTLVNYRQTIFWLIFVLASWYKNDIGNLTGRKRKQGVLDI